MLSPMLCRDGALPEGSGWVGEPQLDGYRALVHTGPQGVAITSRQGRSLTHRFPELAGLADAPPALLDGELVVYRALTERQGTPSSLRPRGRRRREL